MSGYAPLLKDSIKLQHFGGVLPRGRLPLLSEECNITRMWADGCDPVRGLAGEGASAHSRDGNGKPFDWGGVKRMGGEADRNKDGHSTPFDWGFDADAGLHDHAE